MAKSFPFESKNIGSSSSPNWDRAITAQDERDFNKLCWTDGVFSHPVDGLQVTALGGMRVNIKPGGAHIQGARFIEQNNRQITLNAASSTLPRIDRIVLRFDTSESRRDIEIYLKEGVPATTPSPQALIRQSNYYELAIADILVPARATEITNSHITDVRLNTEVCGMVIPAIPYTSATQELWQQISGSIELVNSALDETTAGHLQKEINNLKSSKASTSAVQNVSSRLSTLESFKTATRDYITSVADWTASGITGGKIIKYHSGRCEIFGVQSLSVNYSVQRATGIYATDAITLNFPVTFRKTPIVNANVDGKNIGFVGYTEATTTKSTFSLVNIGGSGTYTSKINWHIIGEI